MSCKVKTVTPFLERDLLMTALERGKTVYRLEGEMIRVPHLDHYNKAFFIRNRQGRYDFQHDSDAGVASFLSNLEIAYQELYREKMERLEKERLELERQRLELERQRRAAEEQKLRELERERLLEEQRKVEEEKRRIEEEKRRAEEVRKAYVESQKVAIIEKAKKKGYRVKESCKSGKVRLVLVRTTY